MPLLCLPLLSTALLTGVRGKTSYVGKGSWPDFVRFGEVPRNFKGAIQVPELEAMALAEASARGIGAAK